MFIASMFIFITCSTVHAGNIYTFGPSFGKAGRAKEYHPFWSFDVTASWTDIRGYDSTSTFPALTLPKLPVPWTSLGIKQVMSEKDDHPLIIHGEIGAYCILNTGLGYSYPLQKYDQGKGARLFLGLPLPLTLFFSDSIPLYIEPYGRVMLKKKGEREYGILIKYFLE